MRRVLIQNPSIGNPPKWIVYEIKGDKGKFTPYASERSAVAAVAFLNKRAGFEKYAWLSIEHYRDRQDQ